ncbi:MAG: ABC-F family ATP-binding cassette domain-containing protein [Candidatus Izimaplasma sp.]|nr:ABC-F family ATP-binding cassette domain-containing protein [Candidatus Izimaplasma bacterium]
MSLLRVNNVTKSFGSELILDNISLDINQNEKIALIGKNGTGKTTLFKIILREIESDKGGVFLYGKTKIGYLSQKIIENEEHTLYEEVIKVFADTIRKEKELQIQAKTLEEDHSEKQLIKYSRLEDEFNRLNGYDYHIKIDTLLTSFGFHKSDYNRVINSFSGGEKTRIAFAKLLMIEPEILLLDEPTNHMDIEIIEWLEDYLKNYRNSVFIITHDKYFINKVVNKIYEIEQKQLELYHGNYDYYEEEKANRYEQRLKQFNKQQKEIAHLQSFVDRFRYKAKKARSAQDRIKKIDRIEKLEEPKIYNPHVNLNFSTKRPTNINIIELNDLTIGYENALISDIDFKMRGFEKTGIIGANGTGKTTLVKTILGEIEPISGEVIFNKKLKIGYFDQNLENFDQNKSLLATVHDRYPNKTLTEVRNDLARVMFTGDDAYKEISILSGGELVKLQILLLMLEKPELLILDEPTNHLDIDTKNIIEDVFEEFNGPILFISHDRYFINKVATKIIKITDKFEMFDGNYSEFIKKSEKSKIKSIKKKATNRKSNLSNEKRLNQLETEIFELENQLKLCKQELFKEEIYNDYEKYQQKNNEVKRIEQDIESIYLELSDLLKK